MGRRRRLRLRRKESPAPVRGRASLAERYGLEGEPDLARFDDMRRRLDAFIAGTGHLDLGERAPSVHTADADEHPLADEKARDMVRMLTSAPSVYAAINEGRFEDAQRLVDEACGPHAGTVLRLDIMIRAGRLDEALSLCDDRMAYEPSEYLIYAKAGVLRELGRMREQIDLYDQWEGEFGGSPDFLAGRAVALVAAGRLEEAEEAAVRALTLEEYALSGYVALGDLLMARGDPAGAIKLFNRVIDLGENEPAGYIGKANALAALGERDRAVLTCNHLLNRVPSHRRLRETRDRIMASERQHAPGAPAPAG